MSVAQAYAFLEHSSVVELPGYIRRVPGSIPGVPIFQNGGMAMISEFVEYVKQTWKNKPNVSSPLNADRLNHMEAGIENNSKKIKETVTAVNELTEKSNSLHFPLTKLSTVDGVNIYYARYGKIVEIIAIGNFSKAETIESGKGITIGVLPVGFRPADVRFFGLGFLYANSSCLTLAIDKTGTITVTSTSATINISSGKYFNFCKHFMIP